MKIRFWGVRGSYPVPGTATNKYGGNTSCVEVRLDDGGLIILDAGTGIRALGKQLIQNGFGQGRGQASLLISHTHWDHIQGFPHFKPANVEGNQLTIYARKRDHHPLKEIFAYQNEGHYYPIALESFKADMEFREISENQTFTIGSAKITTVKLNHPNIALGYRIEADGKVVAYITDTAPFEKVLIGTEFIPNPPDKPNDEEKNEMKELQQKLLAAIGGADLMIYDTFFRIDDYLRYPHWGHSTPEHGVQLCLEAGVKQLALFHHAPGNSDDMMDQMEMFYREKHRANGLSVFAAMEGNEVLL